jgi:hypothetical protein
MSATSRTVIVGGVPNGGSRATAATNGGHAARSSFLAKGQLGVHLDGDGHEGHE